MINDKYMSYCLPMGGLYRLDYSLCDNDLFPGVGGTSLSFGYQYWASFLEDVEAANDN